MTFIVAALTPGLERIFTTIADRIDRMDRQTADWESRSKAQHGPSPTDDAEQSKRGQMMLAQRLAQHLVSTFSPEQHSELDKGMNDGDGTFAIMLEVIAKDLDGFIAEAGALADLLGHPKIQTVLMGVLHGDQIKTLLEIKQALS